MQKEYSGIDIAKFICSLLIVAIHTSPMKSYSPIVNFAITQWLARIAVPFFFIASGYFLFIKTDLECFDTQIPLRSVRKLLKLYVFWTIINLPFTIRDQILTDEKGIAHALIVWVRGFIVSGHGYLWYLNAAIVATLLLTFLLSKKVSIKVILGGAALLYFFGLFAMPYFGILEQLRDMKIIWGVLKLVKKVVVTTRDGFFDGFLFMSIGMLFAYKSIYIKMRKAIILFAVSMTLYFSEVMLIRHFDLARGYDTCLFLVPSAFFLFYVVLHIELPPSRIYKHLRELSMYIYLLHPVIGEILSLFRGGTLTDNSIIKYCLVLIFTILIAECILWFQDKKCS